MILRFALFLSLLTLLDYDGLESGLIFWSRFSLHGRLCRQLDAKVCGNPLGTVIISLRRGREVIEPLDLATLRLLWDLFFLTLERAARSVDGGSIRARYVRPNLVSDYSTRSGTILAEKCWLKKFKKRATVGLISSWSLRNDRKKIIYGTNLINFKEINNLRNIDLILKSTDHWIYIPSRTTFRLIAGSKGIYHYRLSHTAHHFCVSHTFPSAFVSSSSYVRSSRLARSRGAWECSRFRAHFVSRSPLRINLERICP